METVILFNPEMITVWGCYLIPGAHSTLCNYSSNKP